MESENIDKLVERCAGEVARSLLAMGPTPFDSLRADLITQVPGVEQENASTFTMLAIARMVEAGLVVESDLIYWDLSAAFDQDKFFSSKHRLKSLIKPYEANDRRGDTPL